MEGMISKDIVLLQQDYATVYDMKLSLRAWTWGLITKLLEVTHGQWIYRNLLVHDRTTGILATQKKEELQAAIEAQQELGPEGLADEDKFLLEVQLEDLEETSGDRQAYWLLAIEAAQAVSASRQRRNGRQDAVQRSNCEDE